MYHQGQCLKIHQGQRYSRDGHLPCRHHRYRIDVRTLPTPPDPTHPDPKTTPGSCPRVGAWGAPHRPWVGAARRLRRAADSAPEGAEEVLTDILRVLVCPTFAPECKASRFAQPAPVARVPPVCVLQV